MSSAPAKRESNESLRCITSMPSKASEIYGSIKSILLFNPLDLMAELSFDIQKIYQMQKLLTNVRLPRFIVLVFACLQYEQLLFFPTVLSYCLDIFQPRLSNFKLLSANSCCLEQFKIRSLGNG